MAASWRVFLTGSNTILAVSGKRICRCGDHERGMSSMFAGHTVLKVYYHISSGYHLMMQPVR